MPAWDTAPISKSLSFISRLNSSLVSFRDDQHSTSCHPVGGLASKFLLRCLEASGRSRFVQEGKLNYNAPVTACWLIMYKTFEHKSFAELCRALMLKLLCPLRPCISHWWVFGGGLYQERECNLSETASFGWRKYWQTDTDSELSNTVDCSFS